VLFQSIMDHQSAPGVPGDLLAEYLNDGPDIPLAGDETPRINLWLRQGLRPTDGRSVEGIISHFEFEPLWAAYPISNPPLLSPNESTGVPILSSIDT
jgi:hypothetical protein